MNLVIGYEEGDNREELLRELAGLLNIASEDLDSIEAAVGILAKKAIYHLPPGIVVKLKNLG